MTLQQLEALADAYDAAPVTSGRASAAYRRLAEYTLARFADAVRAGWRFTPGDYSSAPDMAEAQRTKTLPVHDRDHGHPELSDAENWAFRAVHDVFGHASVDADFTMSGEIQAARAQLLDFDAFASARNRTGRPGYPVVAPVWSSVSIDDTRAAIWTEIVGQAAYFAIHGRFPIQKAALLTGGL